MEPVTTTAMIGTIVGYLAKKLKDNKSVQDFFSDFSDATVHWIRPLFLKNENEYEKIIQDLLKNPNSPIKEKQIEAVIASHLEDHPNDKSNLENMFEQLKAKAELDSSIIIINSKNVITGTIHATGSVITGDNNSTNNPK